MNLVTLQNARTLLLVLSGENVTWR